MTENLEEKIRDYALKIGFSLMDFAPAELDPKNILAFNSWIKNKFQAKMKYMKKTAPRKDINLILPEAKSVICLATNYYHKQKSLKTDEGRIARYAYGRDYHKVIKKRLTLLEKYIKELIPEIETKSFVDTGPILERAFAEKTSLGFIGKNSCLITKEFGSWVFLSEIITTHPFSFKSESPEKKRFSICGSCSLCIQSCPTKAIIANGIIDANKCLAYHTIENKGRIPKDIQKIMKKTKKLFGCDICQEQCPHNHAPIECKDLELNKKIAGDSQKLSELKKIQTDKEFVLKFEGSPVMRAKRKGLLRNARILIRKNKK